MLFETVEGADLRPRLHALDADWEPTSPSWLVILTVVRTLSHEPAFKKHERRFYWCVLWRDVCVSSVGRSLFT